MAVVMGAPVDIDPHDALLWLVRIAAGEVAYCSQMVEALDQDDAVGRPVAITERPLKMEYGTEDPSTTAVEVRSSTPELNIWIRSRADAMDRLAKYSKMAIDAGVAERQVQLAERYGQMIARLLATVLEGLKLSKAQQALARTVVPEAMRALESGALAS